MREVGVVERLRRAGRGLGGARDRLRRQALTDERRGRRRGLARRGRDGAQHHARLAHDLALAAHRDGHAEHREVR